MNAAWKKEIQLNIFEKFESSTPPMEQFLISRNFFFHSVCVESSEDMKISYSVY